MKLKFPNIFIILLCSVVLFLCPGCSDNDTDVRMPDDILGIWSPGENQYFEYCEENIVHKLDIEYQDNESIGLWTRDVYYYEPGYHLVIYLSGEAYADVYQIVSLTPEEMTWCWVDKVEATDTESVGKIIGEIIKKAQEGYKLNPALYENFRKISEDRFFEILENLDIFYPWGPY